MAKFKEFIPEEIGDKLSKLDSSAIEIISPTLFTSNDDKILFIGNRAKRNRKFPSSYARNSAQKQILQPFNMTVNLMSFLFDDAVDQRNPDEFHFLGPVKDSSDLGRIIVPILVDLDYDSDDVRLRASERWQRFADTHPHLIWVSLDELPDIVVNSGVSENETAHKVSESAATMIDFYLTHDTYIEYLLPTVEILEHK